MPGEKSRILINDLSACRGKEQGEILMIEKKENHSDLSCSGCCSSDTNSKALREEEIDLSHAKWIRGSISTPAGDIPRVETALSFQDIFESWKARWGIRRMHLQVKPGLYGVGNPDSHSPVIVSANYKMSFDRLRKELGGMNAWIMVLDTKGINVWCSAGKGTFGTDEVVKRIEKVGLLKVISHRKLILPQLSAPGVAAHEVTKRSGFKVIYGPVKARDIPQFVKAGLKATPEMRIVRFPFLDRTALSPMELVGSIKPVVIIFGALLALHFLKLWTFSISDFVPYLGAILVGALLVPAFLPWIPGRAFALKGWLLGIVWALGVNIYYGWLFSAFPSWKQSLVYFLLLPAISSFLALNFTGSSTYTSLSGVVREMKLALPLIIVSAGLGVGLMVIKMFVRF